MGRSSVTGCGCPVWAILAAAIWCAGDKVALVKFRPDGSRWMCIGFFDWERTDAGLAPVDAWLFNSPMDEVG
jgi:hypothetical protein